MLEPGHWRQLYRPASGGQSNYGGGGGGASIWSDCPFQLIGSGSGYVSISVQPLLNCFWRIDHQSIWRAVGAAWLRGVVQIILDPPDVEGRATGRKIDFQAHASINGYTPAVGEDTFKLLAGQWYTARLYCVYIDQLINGFVHYTGAPYLRVEGHTFGHGSFK